MTTKKQIAQAADDAIADDFTHEQIAEHLASSNQSLVDIEAQWPGLVSLPAADRV
jgi:hypothetical protein